MFCRKLVAVCLILGICGFVSAADFRSKFLKRYVRDEFKCDSEANVCSSYFVVDIPSLIFVSNCFLCSAACLGVCVIQIPQNASALQYLLAKTAAFQVGLVSPSFICILVYSYGKLLCLRSFAKNLHIFTGHT